MDMSQFIVAKSDQLNADDLAGGPRTITITAVRGNDSADQPVSVCFEGDAGKPYKPCKSMRRVMVFVWGLEAKNYVGHSMTLVRDPDVQFGGMKVGGIRITHMTGLTEKKTMALNATRGKKALYSVEPLVLDAFGLAPVTEGPAAPPKQSAEQWVEQYELDVGGCENIEALMGLQSKSAKALAKLQSDRPELHERAVAAGTKRAAELQAVAA